MLENGGRVLVTGGAGFIGSHLVKRMAGMGYRVRAVDNLSIGKLENLHGVRDGIDFVEGDLRDARVASRVCSGMDIVFHLAAQPNVRLAVEMPLEAFQHCAVTTVNLLNALKSTDIRRFVFSSSAAVYGYGCEQPIRESDPVQPINPYAGAKFAGEVMLKVFAETFKLDSVSLRYFNVFGPRQSGGSGNCAVVPAFLERMVRGERPVIFGSGRQRRDYVHVDDVVEANIAAALHPGPHRGEVYNVGTGVGTDLLQLVDCMNRILGTKLSPKFEAGVPLDVPTSIADVSKIHAECGFRARVSLPAGLQTLANSMRS